jgi:hypothetical protein
MTCQTTTLMMKKHEQAELIAEPRAEYKLTPDRRPKQTKKEACQQMNISPDSMLIMPFGLEGDTLKGPFCVKAFLYSSWNGHVP